VNKVTFSQRASQGYEAVPTATGVEFTTKGTTYHVSCKNEVILCAGAFQSPQILELSGIGSPAILSKYEIPTIVDLPSVGENLQDHTGVPLSYELEVSEPTLDDLSIPGVAASELAKFYATQTGVMAIRMSTGADLSYQQVSRPHGNRGMELFSAKSNCALDACQNEGLKEQYKLQIASILNNKDTSAQIMLIPVGMDPNASPELPSPRVPGSFLTIYSNHAHPFSRGNVHIGSSDPAAYPIIDPNYLGQEIDMQILSDIVMFSQALATKEPLASKLKNSGHGFRPGYKELTNDTVEDFIQSSITSAYHPLGSCSMMPRRLGGVVDTKLRVYGTKGLRVVDASVFPMAIRNNTQSCVYAVAEKASDIIKDDRKHGHGVAEQAAKAKRGLETEELDGDKPVHVNGKKTRME
jgi:choline dehydrogenase